MSRRRRIKRNPPLAGLVTVAVAGIAAYYWWKNRKAVPASGAPGAAVVYNADGSVDRVLEPLPEFVPTANQYPHPIGPTPDGGFLGFSRN